MWAPMSQCDAQQLVDFAVMGEAFARAILGLERPTVGILNVGSEDVKGGEAVRGAAHILRGAKLPMEFCGFVEGDDIAEGTVDVIVTDGFTGNIALKTAEGTAKLDGAFTCARRCAVRCSVASAAVFASRRARARCGASSIRARSTAASFSGLNGVVVKSHGGTDALGFASALDMAIDMARAEVIPKIVADRAVLVAGVRTPPAREPPLREHHAFH